MKALGIAADGCWIDGEDSLYIGEVGGNEGLQKFRRV